jgi:hypothetical protein
VDPQQEEMMTRTRNLSHKKLLLVEDTQTYRPSGTNTIATQEVRIVSNTGFMPIRARIEGWGLDRFRKNALNVIPINDRAPRDCYMFWKPLVGYNLGNISLPFLLEIPS